MKRPFVVSIAILVTACSDGAGTPSSGGAGGTSASSSSSSAASSSGGSGGAGGATGSSSSSSSTGSGGSGGSGGGAPAPLWDMTMIRDASTAACTYTNQHTALKNNVLLDVWEVSYVSWESIAGELQPITIRGFAARPAGQTANLPGVVQAHGLGGFSKEADATGLASLLGTFVIAYTGPGGGDAPNNTSEGRPAGYDDGKRMFDTIPDTRGSWFWGHAVAAMRGLTCVAARPEVDASRLGITGFSAGGVISLIAAGVDDRVVAAVPLSGTHAWSLAVESPDAWQLPLLAKAGYTTASPEWLKLQAEIIDPAATVAKTKGKVLMIDGTTDEFFPLTSFNATFDAIPGADKRASLVGNFDHGCYQLSGVESAATIEERASIRASGGQRMWFSHWFGLGSDYAHLPAAPTVALTPTGAVTVVAAMVDTASPTLDVEEVKIWWSNDDSFIYGNVALDHQGGGLYGKVVAFPVQANTISFVDVQYKTKNLLFPQRFSISSRPNIPPGLAPHIRDMDTCL